MKHYIALSLLTLILFCCGSPAGEKATFWVSGFQVACEAGAGDANCLWVNASPDPEQGQWERLNSPIGGFAFEAGYLKQIEVEAQKAAGSPDSTGVAFTLVAELQMKEDKRMALSGKWELETEMDLPSEADETRPTFEVSLSELRIFGSDGCNRYFGAITGLSESKIAFGQMGATKKMCPDMETPDRFTAALGQTTSYRVENGRLVLLDASGGTLLTFVTANQQ